MLWSTMQVGGILGTMSLSLELIFPAVGTTTWVVTLTLVGMSLGLVGQYLTLERITTVLVALFTFTTLASALLLFWTPYTVSPNVLLDGLRFSLPPDGAVTAFAVFGITGVGATELLLYPYWCVEKGYARAVGLSDGSAAWRTRALGWISVMKKDVWLCMVIYTLATLAFFFLGAAVLHFKGQIPEGFDTVQILSGMYTETLGGWAFYLFGVGAFVVLFTTYFVNIVGQSRMLADALSVLGLVTYRRPIDRQRVVRMIGFLLPLIYAGLYVVWSAPVMMVIIGGLMQTVLLPAIGWAALHFSRTNAKESGIPPSRAMVFSLMAATVVMAIFAVYAVVVRF